MKKERNYSLSHDILYKYLDAALNNASDLLIDATDFLSKERYARAYFFACTALEETGKAYAAFSAMGRNLDNPGVEAAVKFSFENHRSKIVSAFICLRKKMKTTTEEIEKFMKYTIHIEIGREKSMYVDINEKQEITTPTEIIRPEAALDAVRLAKDCLEATGEYILKNKPDEFTAAQDKFLCLSKKKISNMSNTRDFGEFCIDQLKGKKALDMIEIYVKYHDEYYCKAKLFNKARKDSNLV